MCCKLEWQGQNWNKESTVLMRRDAISNANLYRTVSGWPIELSTRSHSTFQRKLCVWFQCLCEFYAVAETNINDVV